MSAEYLIEFKSLLLHSTSSQIEESNEHRWGTILTVYSESTFHIHHLPILTLHVVFLTFIVVLSN